MFFDQRQRLDTVACFGDNYHVPLWFHVCDNPLAHDGVIVGHENSDFVLSCHWY
jgi:hypothetical protein